MKHSANYIHLPNSWPELEKRDTVREMQVPGATSKLKPIVVKVPDLAFKLRF